MLKSLHAYLNLGFHLTTMMMKRAVSFQPPALKQFLSFYKDDFILPYSLEDKDPSLARCILCGLCDSLCPALKTNSGKKILGPSFFPMIARSVPDFVPSLPEDFDEACQECRGCEAICPEKVPIRKVIAFIKNKKEKGSL
ncbi:MAG: hypothetical protein HYT76_04005 [Deltaproteobacteria bacterium]|nr:hypothetical protein [Deltaproteobacteria bacterium]